MIKPISGLFLSLVISVLLSCSGQREFEKVHVFPDATWNRFEILSFDFDVKKAGGEYNMQAILRYTDDLEHNRIPVHFILTFPTGEDRIWEQTISLRDRDGNNLGSYQGGFYEIRVPVRSRMMLREAGIYNITAEKIIHKYNTPGLVSFGLRMFAN